jgi:hypothetical protein
MLTFIRILSFRLRPKRLMSRTFVPPLKHTHSSRPPPHPSINCSLPVIIILILVICLWPRSFLGHHSSRNHPEKFESTRVRKTIVTSYFTSNIASVLLEIISKRIVSVFRCDIFKPATHTQHHNVSI